MRRGAAELASSDIAPEQRDRDLQEREAGYDGSILYGEILHINSTAIS